MFQNLCDFIKDEMRELDRKAANGKLAMQDVEYADKLAHMKKSILAVDAMENPDHYYSDGYSRRNSYDYSDSYGARRRDSMGRYRDDNNMMAELRELMNKAPNEQVRHKYREFISDMESMM